MKQRSPRSYLARGFWWTAWGAGWGAFDAVSHDWLGFGIISGATAVNMVFTAKNYRFAQVRPEPAHRPDYAKIARLEVELGLVPPPKQKTSVAAWAGSVSNGVLPPRYVVTRASGGPCWAPTSGRGMKCYSDCGVMPWGKCPYQPR